MILNVLIFRQIRFSCNYLDMFRVNTITHPQKLSSDISADVSISAVSSVGVSSLTGCHARHTPPSDGLWRGVPGVVVDSWTCLVRHVPPRPMVSGEGNPRCGRACMLPHPGWWYLGPASWSRWPPLSNVCVCCSQMWWSVCCPSPLYDYFFCSDLKWLIWGSLVLLYLFAS